MSSKSQSKRTDPVLLGSTFPMSLIRRRVMIAPAELEVLRKALQARGVASFWGHMSTLSAANGLLGVDVRPATDRPALRLADDGRPMLDGRVFDECWVLSPDYETGFRPALGEEVAPENIRGWQVLKMEWESTSGAES